MLALLGYLSAASRQVIGLSTGPHLRLSMAEGEYI